MAPLTVEIWSDVVCPWCYIGKRRFEAAVERFEHRDEVELRWRSFELDPEAAPSSDLPAAERLAQKYGMSVQDAAAKHAEMSVLAARDGLEFHLDRSRGGNTFDAHRLIALAADHGVQDALKERLMRAYFTDSEPIADHATLARLAGEAGLDASEARAVLDSDRYADAVRSDERLALQIGIRGVPFFVLDRRYGVSGAQPADALLGALEQAWAQRGRAAA